MSTRRTARGTSKAPSEVSGASVVTGATNTPRRRPRQSGPLPAVGTKTSNAYGTNAVQSSVRTSGPQVADQITGVLDNLFDAGMSSQPRRSNTPSKRGSVAGSTVSATNEQNHSFNNESGIFGQAHVASSIQSLSMIEEEFDVQDNSHHDDQRSSSSPEPEPVFTPAQRAHRAQTDALNQASRNIRIGRPKLALRTLKDTLKDVKDSVFTHLHL